MIVTNFFFTCQRSYFRKLFKSERKLNNEYFCNLHSGKTVHFYIDSGGYSTLKREWFGLQKIGKVSENCFFPHLSFRKILLLYLILESSQIWQKIGKSL